MQRGHLWVALDADSPVGFAQVEMLASDHPHLHDSTSTPLTTFRRVPWNMPWYTRPGFVELPPEDWRDEVRRQVATETARGLDPARRLVMAYRCGQ